MKGAIVCVLSDIKKSRMRVDEQTHLRIHEPQNTRYEMFSKVSIICCCSLILSGCIYNDEPMPKITHDYTRNNPVPKIVQPSAWKPSQPLGNVLKEWLPPLRVEKRWTAIVIHHSLTASGNAAVFDNYHKNGHKWKGIGYDFVIGNGNGSGDGRVEVTFRWRQQIAGAHCGGTPGNWANKDAVGICLVGDFSKTAPTGRQMQSLVKLIHFLQKRYGIPKSRIYGHRNTPGYTGGTKCPGNFPMARLKSMLDN